MGFKANTAYRGLTEHPAAGPLLWEDCLLSTCCKGTQSNVLLLHSILCPDAVCSQSAYSAGLQRVICCCIAPLGSLCNAMLHWKWLSFTKRNAMHLSCMAAYHGMSAFQCISLPSCCCAVSTECLRLHRAATFGTLAGFCAGHPGLASLLPGDWNQISTDSVAMLQAAKCAICLGPRMSMRLSALMGTVRIRSLFGSIPP